MSRPRPAAIGARRVHRAGGTTRALARARGGPARARRALLLALGLLALPVAADAPLPAEPHLAVVPRTVAEAARVAAVTAPPSDFSEPEPFEANPGGAATVPAGATASAFSRPQANLSFEDELTFRVGDGIFRKLWVSAPASTAASDGLGPVFNARSCQTCHLKDGRGHPPDASGAISLVVRAGIPGLHGERPPGAPDAGHGAAAPGPDPVYGRQIGDLSLPGVPAEAKIAVTWHEEEVTLGDGEAVSLRRPEWRLADLGHGPLDPATRLSPRVAPQMIGLGLVEAIPAADILALADPDDADGDGVSGRASMVWSPEWDAPMLGRFGVRATTATLRQQAADAFANDIGVGSPLRPEPWGECTEAQAACRAAPDGGDADRDGLEIDAKGLDLVTFYSRTLGVPARRDLDDPEVLRGKRLFHEAGCAACHRPKFVTHRLADRPEHSFQLVWPYSDFLLHDMGPGLADELPAGAASGSEWRTPPLWGTGLTEQVSGHSLLLHDGRARSRREAILWHGGEAEAARDAFTAMPEDDRDALIRFLESL